MPREVPALTTLWGRVGGLQKNLRPQAGSSGKPEVTNVSRIVAPGGSIYRLLRSSDAPGGPASKDAVKLGLSLIHI